MSTNSAGRDYFDAVVIGSGFGGSVAALRLVEKGYSVLVLERGKRYEDQDFPKSNWNVFKYLWAPPLRCFGILQLSTFRDVWVLHGSGVGGGSLVYANVLEQPSDLLFNNPSWKHLADWKQILLPHYATAKRMLGVTRNPRYWQSDQVLQEIATELGTSATFRPTEVGVFFGNGHHTEGELVPDPYFQGEGPARNTCTHCGGCMVGCRYNAKNSLMKNYLYLAEKYGARIRAESEVYDVRTLPPGQPDGARYEVFFRNTTGWWFKKSHSVRVRMVFFAAGALGSLRLLFFCRDIARSLPKISQRLGELVRTNSEALLGATSRTAQVDYSKGIAITSIFSADAVTAIEPVRFPAGSSFLRLLAGPLVEHGGNLVMRFLRGVSKIISHPVDFARTYILPGWAQHTTILLVMQTEDNHLRLRLGRDLFTLGKTNLVSEPDAEKNIPAKIDIGHRVTHRFAQKINAAPAGSINEGLLNIPLTAHILGGCPMGLDDQQGVVDINCQIHNYPGLYIVDGAIVPANPGVNPSLTITALAEYAMSRIPTKNGQSARHPIGVAVSGENPAQAAESLA